MKIITWNVNGIRAVERKKNLQEYVSKEAADIFLFQEIKGNREQFSAYLTEHPEYDQYYHSAEKKGYAGTGVWARKDFIKKCKNVAFHTDVPHMPNADEGRIAHLSFDKGVKSYDVFSIYFPNGGKSEQAWNDKLIFFDTVLDHMNRLRKKGRTVIVGGDMNVAHTEIDLTRSKENDGKIGFHPDERAWMDRVITDGWHDAWRTKNPGVEEVYSYWDTITRSRDRNVGWRIDYFFVDDAVMKKMKDVQYLTAQLGSDHCPLSITL